jgi:hypothetical protein
MVTSGTVIVLSGMRLYRGRNVVTFIEDYAIVCPRAPMVYREIGAHAERFESLSADGVSEKDMKNVQRKVAQMKKRNARA